MVAHCRRRMFRMNFLKTAILASVLFANACSDSSQTESKSSPVIAAIPPGTETGTDTIGNAAPAAPAAGGGASPTASVPTTQDASSSCYKGDPYICEIESIIDVETNKLRASSGKSSLVHTKEHSFVSRTWSEQMASAGKIGHEGFPAVRKADYLKEFGKSTNYSAENVAMINDSGTNAAKIAEKFVTMWWGSEGHKANMLGNHKNIGSGVAKQGNRYYATQLFN
ncbi:MAG: CAP domain-containing protein [Proteobacteria bacterium]|nr:MAG: CAP domain-containing protein [Pseudomonadota bacterium]